MAGKLVIFRSGLATMSSLCAPACVGKLGFQKLPFVVSLGPHVFWLESGVCGGQGGKGRYKPDISRDAYLPEVGSLNP
jgi:hypothetical protein